MTACRPMPVQHAASFGRSYLGLDHGLFYEIHVVLVPSSDQAIQIPSRFQKLVLLCACSHKLFCVGNERAEAGITVK
jgi:hypothetical protein